MSDLLNYRGYHGSVRYSAEDRVFFGKLEFIRSLITFEATDVEGLERAFREAVDDWLATCEEQGVEPEMPFKGSFNVRTGQELHRQAALLAAARDTSLNQVVNEALAAYLQQDD